MAIQVLSSLMLPTCAYAAQEDLLFNQLRDEDHANHEIYDSNGDNYVEMEYELLSNRESDSSDALGCNLFRRPHLLSVASYGIAGAWATGQGQKTLNLVFGAFR